MNGLHLTPPAILYTSRPADKIYGMEKFTIFAALTPESAESNGYARILTYSLNGERPNFMVGQWSDALIFIVNAANRPWPVHFEVDGVLEKGIEKFISIVFDGEKLVLYQDGQKKSERKTGPLSFSNWKRSYPLVVGSEASGKFPWAGKIIYMAIFDRAMSKEEIGMLGRRPTNPGTLPFNGESRPLIYYDFANGAERIIKDQGRGTPADLTMPEEFTPYKRAFLEMGPWGRLAGWGGWKDIMLNVLLFMPLGFLLCGYLASRGFELRSAVFLTVLAGFSLSLGVESLQAFLPTRESDLRDVIANTIGTAIGAYGTRIVAGFGFRVAG